MALTVSADLPPQAEAVHVMDEEADDYDVLHAAGLRDVIRSCPTRQTTDGNLPVRDVLARQAGSVIRTVPLTPRSSQKAVKTLGRHLERTERLATLHVRWGAVTLPRRH